MSQQASVTLNTIVYDPAGTTNGVAKWVNRVGGILNSFSMLTQRFLTGAGARSLTKVTFRVEIPIVSTVDSSCNCAGTVLRTNSVQFDYWIAADATATERLDLFNRAKDLAASSLVGDNIKDLNPAYS